MSEHATVWVPKSRFGQWFESRLPLGGLIHSSFIAFPVPRNLNYFWTTGGIAFTFLVLQIVTGVVLAMHYVPDATKAFDSVEHIMRNVNYGWLLRYMHANGASMFFVAVYLHIFRNLYYGSYKAPREILFILGVIIFLLMMATAFMGYVLPWGQMSYWGATVITNLFSAIPVVGDTIVTWLWGGFNVDNPTLNRFFSLHYLLPFVIVGVVVLHLIALHQHGSNNPLGIDRKGPQDSIPFHPYYTVKDLFGLFVFLLVYAYFIFFDPMFFLAPENLIPPNPLVTPPEIVPEWYLLPFYAILRSIPNKLLGVIAMFGSLFILFVVPWLDTSKVRSATFRPIYKWVFWLLPVDGVALAWVGAHPPEGANVVMGQVATFYYFLHFLILMPVIGWMERPRPLPESINQAVLQKGAGRLATASVRAEKA